LVAPFFKSLPLQTNKQQEELSLQKRPLLSVALFLFASLAKKKQQQAKFSLSKRPFLSVALFLFAPRCRSRRGRPADSPPPSQISVVFIFALL
jgi:hypothetical protein